jgi:isochorismate hydrolase
VGDLLVQSATKQHFLALLLMTASVSVVTTTAQLLKQWQTQGISSKFITQ